MGYGVPVFKIFGKRLADPVLPRHVPAHGLWGLVLLQGMKREIPVAQSRMTYHGSRRRIHHRAKTSKIHIPGIQKTASV